MPKVDVPDGVEEGRKAVLDVIIPMLREQMKPQLPDGECAYL